MGKVIIVRYSEIHLKGKNRGYFERILILNMEKALKGIKHEIKRTSGRYIVDGFDEFSENEILSKLKKVFGIHSLSVALKVETDMDKIFAAAKEVCFTEGTFKVSAHRADKSFKYDSMQINAEIGGRLLSTYKNLCVDVHNPSFIVNIDVREDGTTLIFNHFHKGAGGMPAGTSGKGMLLISGGIDSPVAGYMIAKRGMQLECIHFHSYPYTNMQARDKVIELAQVLAKYTGGIKMHIVSVTHIQEEIHKRCNGVYMVTLLRRFMMRIAEELAKKNGAQCLITGESLGQVASQTIEGMTSSNSVINDLPVLRPLCGFDKDEIIERSRQISAYDISIRPYEDCCTVFLPKHPVIKPSLQSVLEEEEKLDVENLINKSLSSVETINL